MRQGDPRPAVEGSLGFFARRNRGDADLEALLSTLLTDNSAPGAVAEADPLLAELKKSKAYGVLYGIKAIDENGKILHPYFRAQKDLEGVYERNVVYKIEGINHRRVTLTYMDSGHLSDSRFSGVNGGFWETHTFLTASESEYLNQKL